MSTPSPKRVLGLLDISLVGGKVGPLRRICYERAFALMIREHPAHFWLEFEGGHLLVMEASHIRPWM